MPEREWAVDDSRSLASVIVTSPTVDPIDGGSLAELVEEKAVGVQSVTRVNETGFDPFDSPVVG
ncbi:MAG TPA: hypothetical protein GX718_11555 [Brevibacterium sp.]|nr:hypothetical protein [Brevibacterium sp.]